MLRIAILEGGREVRSQLFESGPVRLGRDSSNDVMLSDGYVSSRHGELRHDGERLVYEDFMTTNGSLRRRSGDLKPVDEATLHRVEVRDGDELLLGDSSHPVVVRVHVVAAPDALPDRAAASDRTLLGLDVPVDVTRAGAVSALSAGFDREALIALNELSSRITSHLRLDELLDALAASVMGLFRKANHVSVYLQDAASSEYRPALARSRNGDAEERPISRTVRDKVLACGQALAFRDTDAGFRASDSLHESSVRAGICAPLWNGRHIIGLVQVDRRGTFHGDFDRRDLEVLAVFAHQAAVAIENARLHEGLQATVESSIRGLVRALEAKDEYTSGHSEAVADLCELVAREAGCDEETVRTVSRAALLHDIGKIGIPYHVLNKEGRLTPEEFRLLRSHPELGARILEPFDFLSHLVPIVLHHHERWDGKGYPDGLAREEIPWGARILAVVDTYHALVSDRAYRAGVDPSLALSELRRCSGSQFDPRVVEHLATALAPDELADAEPCRDLEPAVDPA